MPNPVVEDIKARIDLRLVIPDLEVKGTRHFRKCPFHGGGEERTASMMVEADHYFCFACQEHGDVFDWLEKHDGMEFKEALVHLASELGIALDADDVRALQKRAKAREQVAQQVAALESQADPAREYLRSRGLNDEIMDLAHVGYEEQSHAAILPFCDAGGRPIGVTKRYMADDAETRYKTFNNDVFKLRDNVWGLQVAVKAKGDHLYLVEGQIDCMSLWQHGIKRAVAYVMGAPTTGQLRQLARYFPEDEWVLVPDNKSDNDWEIFERAYGRIMEVDSARLCRVVMPPIGADVNQALQDGNMDWTAQMRPVPLVRAEHITTNGMPPDAQYLAGRVIYKETPDELVRGDLVSYFATQWGKDGSTVRDYFDAENGEAPSVRIRTISGALDVAEEQVDAMIEKKWHLGFTPLRGLIPYPAPGKLMGLVARPTVGKTTFAINLIRKMRDLHLPTLVVSYEQAASELAIKLALCTAYEMNHPISYQDIYTRIHTRATDQTWAWMRGIMTQLYPHVIFCEDNPSADELPALIAHYGMQTGKPIELVILDYLNLIPPPAGQRYSGIYDITTARMEALKMGSKQSQALWFYLHHTGRVGSKTGEQRLDLDAGKGSSAVEDLTDYLLTMWYGEMVEGARKTTVNLVKNKGGKPGEFTLYHAEEYAIMESTVIGAAVRQSQARMGQTVGDTPEDPWATEEADPFEDAVEETVVAETSS